jgi:uncharacterized protein (DUF58 family)
MAAELAAVLALTATRNNDRVGLMLCSDRIEHVVPPRKGRRHALRLVRDVLAWPNSSRGTNLALALEYASRVLTHHALVFVISDFVTSAIDRPLKLLSQRHDLVAVVLDDPGERALPDLGVARLVDPETGRFVEIDTSALTVRTRYGKELDGERAARQQLLRRLAIDEVLVRTEKGYAEPLLRFFNSRETRGRKTRRR